MQAYLLKYLFFVILLGSCVSSSRNGKQTANENIIDESGEITNYSPDLLSLGIEINTGGHLFQFFVGNTMNSSNIDQLARNTGYLKDGNLAFGFTINRSMNLKKEKELSQYA